MDLSAIQSALRERNIDAWLFYDHHHRDPIAYRVLGLPASLMVTRRWFYLIPAQGEPVKLVHKIEAGHLDGLSGSKRQYSGWQELFDALKSMLAPYRDIAMQYSPNNIVFTISLVDGGTIELLRAWGKTWSAPPIWWLSLRRPGASRRSKRTLLPAIRLMQSSRRRFRKSESACAIVKPPNTKSSNGSWRRLAVKTW
jgi:hypothetical protein